MMNDSVSGNVVFTVGQKVRLIHSLVGDGYLPAETIGKIVELLGDRLRVQMDGKLLILDQDAVEPSSYRDEQRFQL